MDCWLVAVFGRKSPATILGGGGGWQIIVSVCVVTCGWCPTPWTSRASDPGSGELQSWGVGSHPPKVGWGPRHWDWGAEPFQKRQVKVQGETPGWESGLWMSYTA